jgi:hypothetical protein
MRAVLVLDLGGLSVELDLARALIGVNSEAARPPQSASAEHADTAAPAPVKRKRGRPPSPETRRTLQFDGELPPLWTGKPRPCVECTQQGKYKRGRQPVCLRHHPNWIKWNAARSLSEKKNSEPCRCGKRECDRCRHRAWYLRNKALKAAEKKAAHQAPPDIPDVIAWAEQNEGPRAPHSTLDGDFGLFR